MQLNGITALVTGGTDGIGLALARRLRAEGAARIIVCGRSEDRLAAARAEGFEPIKADLATIEGCDALVAALGDGPLDLLVNNAGMQVFADFNGAPDVAAIDQEWALNYRAPIRLIAGLLPVLRERRAAAIVNVTSGLALAPKASAPGYSATKAALRSFSKSLRYQLADTPVRVIEALPPMVDTAMTSGRGKAAAKLSPDGCARQIVDGIKADRANVYVGMTKLLVAIQRLSPALADRIMLRMV